MRLRPASWLILGLLFLLHNDLWLWNDGRIVLGLPVGLLYHVGYCVVAALVLWGILRRGLAVDATDTDSP